MKGHSFSNSIRELRTKSDMRQEDLAEKVGVTRQTIIALEQNRYMPSLELAFKFARLFNIKLEDVFQYH